MWPNVLRHIRWPNANHGPCCILSSRQASPFPQFPRQPHPQMYRILRSYQTSGEPSGGNHIVKGEDSSLPRSPSEEMMQFTDYRMYEQSVMEREDGLRLDLQQGVQKDLEFSLEDVGSIFHSESPSTASDSPFFDSLALRSLPLPSEPAVNGILPDHSTRHCETQNRGQWEEHEYRRMAPERHPSHLFASSSKLPLQPVHIIYQPVASAPSGPSYSVQLHPLPLPFPSPFIALHSPPGQQPLPSSLSRSPFYSTSPTLIQPPTVSSHTSPFPSPSRPVHVFGPPSWLPSSHPSPTNTTSWQGGLTVSPSRPRPALRCDSPKKRAVRSTRSIVTAAGAQKPDEDVDAEDFTSQMDSEGKSNQESEFEAPKRRNRPTLKDKEVSSATPTKAGGDQESNKVIPVAISVLKPKPKLPPSKWQIYFATYLRRERDRKPDEKMNVANIARDAAVAYKTITLKESDDLNAQVKKAKAEYARELKKWERTLTPEDIKNENAFRTAQRRAGQSRKSNMKDPNAPKKPMSPYFIFLQKIRESPELTEAVWGNETETTVQSKLAAAKWRGMTKEEKEPFLSQADSEKQDYTVKYKEYEHAAAGPQHGEDDGDQS